MGIDKNYHLFSRHSISTIVFQISNLLSFIKKTLNLRVFFVIFREFLLCLRYDWIYLFDY